MRSSRTLRRDGFALPAVLAVTGVVTLIFLVAITALASLTAEAASARARVRFLQRALTAEATLSYMAATEPMRAYGFAINDARGFMDLAQTEPPPNLSGAEVQPVRLDGRPFLMEVDGPLVVRMRDEAGMINMALLYGQPYERLMERLGVDAGQRQEMIARYQDYVDTDDLKQPNGAERGDYPDGGPANRRLMRPAEWLSILGAREAVNKKAWRELRDDLAADPMSAAVNVNTASSNVLGILFGMSEDQAQALIRAREQAPLMSATDIANVTGMPFGEDFERIYTYPAGVTVITIRDTRSAWTYRARLSLTPSGLEQPLWIDQTELTEAPRRAVADTSDATRLPYTPR
ncbi:general secretion pathway protein GspK [Brevundimonas sp. NPDC046655]|uniref:general secretion pathway protein GspK n=1 Tax=unclassified Brevundimonas TaxID=2622653 RepID=UPI00384F5D4A